MNIKTNLLEEYVDIVDTTKKRNKKLWICTILLLFLVINLKIIGVFRYVNEYQFLLTKNTKDKQS